MQSAGSGLDGLYGVTHSNEAILIQTAGCISLCSDTRVPPGRAREMLKHKILIHGNVHTIRLPGGKHSVSTINDGTALSLSIDIKSMANRGALLISVDLRE